MAKSRSISVTPSMKWNLDILIEAVKELPMGELKTRTKMT